MPGCLTESEIEALALGSPPSPGEEQLGNHLDRCARCRAAVEARRADQLLFAQIQGALRVEPESVRSQHAEESQRRLGLTEPVPDIDGYEILFELHRGGQGIVYKAVQRATKRAVALKILRQGAYATPPQRQRFEREIDLVASLRHPNIVTIYDCGMSHGQPFYAMEFVEGLPLDRFMLGGDGSGVREGAPSARQFAEAESLKAGINSSPSPSPPVHHRWEIRETVALFHRICSAVGYAHRHGVIHRDLKPANILIDQAHAPHILDFGLAKLAAGNAPEPRQALTHTGEFLGTLAYASPEQAKGDPQLIDVRSDVYSLGVLFFEMLTGTLPYPVTAPLSEVLKSITESEPPRPSTIRREIDSELETLVLKALAKEPVRRYQTADHLARDIEHYMNGDPIDAKRDSIWYLLRKSIGRHQVAVATALVFLTVIAVALFVSAHLWRAAVIERDVARKAQQNERAARFAEVNARRDEQRHREEAEFQSYVANVAAASAALRSLDVVEANQRLQLAPRRLRNWEWAHLATQVDQSVKTLRGHGQYLYGADFSPDGSTIVTGGWDHSVRLWSTASGQPLSVITGDGPVRAVSFNPDGIRIAIGRWNNNVEIWNTDSSHIEQKLAGRGGHVTDVEFSPDGSRIAAAFNALDGSAELNQVIIWDVATGKPVRSIRDVAFPNAIAFSSDGNAIAACGHDVSLWDVGGTDEQPRWRSSSSNDLAMGFCPVGSVLACGNSDGIIRLRDFRDGQVVRELRGHTGPVHSVAFSLDGKVIASGSRDKVLRLWEVGTGAPIAALLGHTWTITGTHFHPNGHTILSASWDGTAKIWELRNDPGVFELSGHERGVSAVVFNAPSETTQHIVTSSWDKTARIWDLQSGAHTTLSGHTEPVQCVSLSSDGKLVATASWDRTVRLWRLADGREVRTLRGHTDRVQGVAFSPATDSPRLLASGSRDNSIRLWDAESGNEVAMLRGHNDHVHCVAFSPRGDWLASSGHQSLKVWDVKNRVEIVSFSRTIVQEDFSLVFDPTGRFIAAGSDVKTLTIWDIMERKAIASIEGHTDEISSVAFSPDGTRLVSCSADGMIKVWDSATWREVAALQVPRGKARCVAFSGDGAFVAAGLDNGVVRIWATRHLTKPYVRHPFQDHANRD